MKIADNVEMLEIDSMGSKVYLTLAWDENSLALVDAGYPGQTDAIVKAIKAAGFAPEKLTHLIFTHQDMDHIGCARDLLKLSPSAQTMSHAEEEPCIAGKKTPVKLAAALEKYDSLTPERKSWCERLQKNYGNCTVPVNRALSDGEVLPICGGIEIIHTPGHTPGHICLYLRESRVLVTGDALNVQDGALAGPNPVHTYDMEQGLRSAEKAKKFPFRAAVSHHGGYVKLS